MGVSNVIGIAIGIEADEVRDARAKGLLARYKDGELPGIQEDSDFSGPAFQEWWLTRSEEDQARTAGVDALGAGAEVYGGQGRTILGAEASRLEIDHWQTSYAEPIRRADLARLVEQVRRGLRGLGDAPEPRVFLRYEVH